MSSGPSLAYSTNTSKYRSSSKTARIHQFVLELLPRPPAVRLHQVAIGKLPLRVLVQVLHVGVRRSAVDVEVVLLDILAMVALAVSEPEQALLQDGIPLVPQREGKAQPLLVIADSSQSVFAPAVRAGARLVVREIVPRVSILAVVFADRAPLPLAEIGPPFFPRDPASRASFNRFCSATSTTFSLSMRALQSTVFPEQNCTWFVG